MRADTLGNVIVVTDMECMMENSREDSKEVQGPRTLPHCFTPRFSSKEDDEAPSDEMCASISSCKIATRLISGQVFLCRTSYSPSLLTTSNTSVKSTKAMCSRRRCSRYFWIWRSEKIMTVVDLLRREPHCDSKL